MIYKLEHPIETLQQRIPVVGDKALVDLVNGINVRGDILRYRRGRSFLRHLADRLGSKDEKLQMLLDSNFLIGQDTLHQWILELCDSVRISQVALQATQTSLLEARSAIRQQHRRLENQDDKLLVLSQRLNQISEQVGQRLDRYEERLQRLELRVAAKDDLERVLAAWVSGQTYTQLPWALQVVLLAREVFSSDVVTYELQTHDQSQFRQFFINRIVAESRQMPQSFFGLAQLLDQSWIEMADDDQELITGLLEVRSVPRHRLQSTPHLFTIGTTLELATLPQAARPAKPAECAIELCRAQIGSITYVTDIREFVNHVVEETANDCLAIMTGSLR